MSWAVSPAAWRRKSARISSMSAALKGAEFVSDAVTVLPFPSKRDGLLLCASGLGQRRRGAAFRDCTTAALTDANSADRDYPTIQPAVSEESCTLASTIRSPPPKSTTVSAPTWSSYRPRGVPRAAPRSPSLWWKSTIRSAPSPLGVDEGVRPGPRRSGCRFPGRRSAHRRRGRRRAGRSPGHRRGCRRPARHRPRRRPRRPGRDRCPWLPWTTSSAVTAGDGVVAQVAEQPVVAEVAPELVVPLAAVDQVVAPPAVDQVVPGVAPGRDHCPPGCPGRCRRRRRRRPCRFRSRRRRSHCRRRRRCCRRRRRAHGVIAAAPCRASSSAPRTMYCGALSP